MKEWVSLARQGEETAWNHIYQQYYPSLFAKAVKICGSGTTAKDAVQNTFVTAYLKLAQLKDPATIGAWLHKILVHTCFRMQQGNKKHSHAELPAESCTYWENSVDNKLERLYARGRLYANVASLPETLRGTLMLRYFSECTSYEDIASVLAIPVGTVRSRLNQARQQLAEKWSQKAEISDRSTRLIEEWNQFYLSHFGGLHESDEIKKRLLNHFDENMQLTFTSGASASGRALVDREVQQDRMYGSWFKPTNAITAGNISIVEAQNFNSAEYPDRCPPSVVFVLYRNGSSVHKLHFNLR